MTTFREFLIDLHLIDKIEQDFDDWVESIWADTLWEFFTQYISKIKEPRKLWKIAYILFQNQ
jgi:hypothetical protein